ncbi:hypothetical protein WQ57_08400 [Mesobacillus campisalis]|uniref:Uncharacterized protein n=1 Tax=Mesobacillus campisalis TaxID=1408103 RepID=A0A0M2SY80_9BACI|nr:hypothetical protein WQ57_08400 [Mesobacillus campisalis]
MRGNGMIPAIGQPWMGKHILLLHCSEDNKFLSYYKSDHAPIEPPSFSCAESLSRLISIGYAVNRVTPLPGNRLQYLLVL